MRTRPYCPNPAWLWLCALPASASLLFNDSFDYPDGPLTGAPGTPWVIHGGTALQADVLSGMLQLTEQNSEDVSVILPGAPYNQGALYASCLVNFTSPPSGHGTFFLHFKDTGNVQKGRVYATTDGAAPGNVRLGVANGTGTPVYIPRDLPLTSTHRIVLRHAPGLPNSSILWIDPIDEADTTFRVEALDNNRVANLHALALRESLSLGDGMGTLFIDDLRVGTGFSDVAGPNTPPTLSSIPDQRVAADQLVGPIPFTVGDKESPPEHLSVTLSSSNPALLSPAGASFQGTGADRTLTLRPTAGLQGVATIRLEVSDGAQSSSTTFLLVVGAPAIRGPSTAETPMDHPVDGLLFTLSDHETLPEQLLLTVTSSAPSLIPPEGIRWTGTGAERSLRLTPVAGATGVATLSIQVSDGLLSATNTLVVTVHPPLAMLLSEDFTLPDGSLIVPGGTWLIHAPDPGDPANIRVAGGRLELSSTRGEDVHASLAGGPWSPGSGAILYAALRLRCRDLPTAAGGFFGHFRDDHTAYRGRVYLALSESDPGRYRVGVASASGVPVFESRDHAPGEWVAVVVKYNVGTGETRLWVNPTVEADPSLRASDDPLPVTISNWSFRQGEGIGTVEVDDLRVAGSFGLVLSVGSAPRLEIGWSDLGGVLRVTWPGVTGYALQRSGSLSPALWVDESSPVEVQAGSSSVTLGPTGAAGLFRLIQR